MLICRLRDVEEATLARKQCAALLQQGAGTGQLWHSCLARLLLGEVTCTHMSCMPFLFMLGRGGDREGFMPGAPCLWHTLDVYRICNNNGSNIQFLGNGCGNIGMARLIWYDIGTPVLF